MEDNFTLDWLSRAAVISSAFTMPIISILLIIGLINENKILLTIGTVVITILGIAFLISDIVVIVKLIELERSCNNSKKQLKKN